MTTNVATQHDPSPTPIPCDFGGCTRPATHTMTVGYPATPTKAAWVWGPVPTCKTCVDVERWAHGSSPLTIVTAVEGVTERAAEFGRLHRELIAKYAPMPVHLLAVSA